MPVFLTSIKTSLGPSSGMGLYKRNHKPAQPRRCCWMETRVETHVFVDGVVHASEDKAGVVGLARENHFECFA